MSSEPTISSPQTDPQVATVSRYCAIEGTECYKQIPYKGEGTFFFAYPSQPQWKDFSKRLVGELSDRGICGDR